MNIKHALAAIWSPRTQLAEALFGAVLLGRSLGTIWPGQPQSGAAYQFILGIASQSTWGVVGLMAGLVAIVAAGTELITGRPRHSSWLLRFFAATISAFLTLALGLGFAMAPTPVAAGVGTYGVMGLCFLYCAARIMAER